MPSHPTTDHAGDGGLLGPYADRTPAPPSGVSHVRPLRRRRTRSWPRRLRRRHPRRPAGQAVAVVEEKYWGGVCLNVGCIPTKALLRNAELAHIFNHEAKTFGIKVDGTVSFDYGEAFRRSRSVADGRVKGVHFLMKRNGITEFNGRGTFLDREHR
ncbi:hypothetical protein STANM309S_05496 [Streptomyces tanashiensis]